MTKSTIPLHTFESRDEYNRATISENMVKLLESDLEVFPMLLDGPWGSGKTEFCLKLQARVSEKLTNYHVIYIDAFQSDHMNDPLIMLLGNLAKHLPAARNALPQLAKVIAPLGKIALKAGIQILTRQNLDTVCDEIKTAVNDGMECAVANAIEACQKTDDNINALKEAVHRIASGKTLFFIIDELDRCRPDFAVELIEKIKHIFNMPDVKFLLVANSKQLHASIQHKYGTDIEAKRYLDKFLKFSITFPRIIPGTDRRIEHQHLLTTLQEHNLPFAKNKTVMVILEAILTKQKKSFREIETFMRYICVFHRLYFNNEKERKQTSTPCMVIYIIATYCFCFEEDITEAAISGEILSDKINQLYDCTVSKKQIRDSENGNMIAGLSSTQFNHTLFQYLARPYNKTESLSLYRKCIDYLNDNDGSIPDDECGYADTHTKFKQLFLTTLQTLCLTK